MSKILHTLTVYPVSGRLVRQPKSGEPVPEEGLCVPRSPYWLRRLKDGDVLAEPEKKTKERE